jgi:hypothetical protein
VPILCGYSGNGGDKMSFDPHILPRDYLDHSYNQTLKNERCIEVPLGRRWVEGLNNTSNLIEVGAVLPYYQSTDHKVVDLYDEKATLTADVMDVDYTGMNVLSISTIEHIGTTDYTEGWGGVTERTVVDENAAILALKKILDESESCFITIPIGYNSPLDGWLRDNVHLLNCFPYEKIQHYDKSVWPPALSPVWEFMIEDEEAFDALYFSPYPSANVVLVIQGWR